MKNLVFDNVPIETEECYVAFLDIQGFKEYVIHHTLSDTRSLFMGVVNELSDIRKTNSSSWLSDDKRKEMCHLSKYTYITLISDSIVIAIEKKHSGALSFLLSSCIRVQLYLLLYHNIVIRGGISAGSLYASEPFLFGTSIVNAYNLEHCAENFYFRILVDNLILLKETDSFLLSNVMYDESHTNSKPIRMLDYFSRIPWRNTQIADAVISFVKFQLAKARQNKNAKLIEKYEWLEMRMAYSSLEYEKTIQEHEKERSFRRKSLL